MTANQPAVWTTGSVPTLVLARTPGHLIRRAQRVHGVLWAGHVGAEPTGPQFAVLSCVSLNPGLDQTAAGVLASLDKSSMADIVGRLIRNRWITADPDAADRRRKLLYLSRPALAALDALTAGAARVQADLLAPLPPGQRARFVRDLATLAYEGAPPAVPPRAADLLGLELSMTPGHLIRRAQQAYTLLWTNRFQGSLTGPQYAVLCALARQESSDQATIGAAASLDKSSVAGVVDRLASRGLVTVLADAADRRRKALRLSAAAILELPRLTEDAAAVQAELLELLPAGDQEPFLGRLAAVAYQDSAQRT